MFEMLTFLIILTVISGQPPPPNMPPPRNSPPQNIPPPDMPPPDMPLDMLEAKAALTTSPGFTIYGVPESSLGTSVGTSADFNNDGIDDLLIGGPNLGEAYVLFGQPTFNITVNSSNLDGTDGFRLKGGFDCGFILDVAGDFNGDGWLDIILGAPKGSPNGVYLAGIAYLLFGRRFWPPYIDLTTLNGTTGIIFHGVSIGEQAGTVSGIGDLNKDGYADIAIGAPLASYNDLIHRGRVTVVFGRQGPFPSVFNLSDVNGTNGFSLYGNSEQEQAGYGLGRTGDFLGDGTSGLIIAAPFAAVNGETNTGRVYGILGSSNLSNSQSYYILEEEPNGVLDGFVFDGMVNDYIGFGGVSLIGDFNGDGFDDIVIGSPHALSGTGEAYVLFGQPGTSYFPRPFNKTVLQASLGFQIIGGVAGGTAGFVGNGGDVNNDGFADLLIGGPMISPAPHLSRAGQTYLIFGNASLKDTLSLTHLDKWGAIMSGSTVGSLSGFAVGVDGDFNGDGYKDILIGAPGTPPSPGQGIVVYGRDTVQRPFPASWQLQTLNDCWDLPNISYTTYGTCHLPVPYQSSCRLHCAPGYGIVGGTLDTSCTTMGGVLANVSGSCQPLPCDPIDLPRGVDPLQVDPLCLDGTAVTGDVCNFSCLPGFRHEGETVCVGRERDHGDRTWSEFESDQKCCAANCPAIPLPPQTNESSVPWRFFANKTRTNSDDLNFECNNGFERSGVIQCLGTGPGESRFSSNFSCKPVTCPPFFPPPHASVSDLCLLGLATTGSLCEFQCDPGFVRNGSTVCKGVAPSISVWFSDQTCQPTRCEGLTLPHGVNLSTVNPLCTNGEALTGDVCEFNCLNGYSRRGTTTCLGVGPGVSAFNSTQNCIAASCGPLILPIGANASSLDSRCLDGKASTGMACPYRCLLGFSHSGHTTCVGTGPGVSTFTSDQTCHPSRCGALPLPSGATRPSPPCRGDGLPGDQCLFDCLEGYAHQGVSFCMGIDASSSHWVSNQTCIASRCHGMTSLPSNVISADPLCTDGTALPGQICRFNCKSGYTPYGETRCVGIGTGSYFHSNQTCVPARCRPARIPTGAINISPLCLNGSATLGEPCTYECGIGYVHSGVTVCSASGTASAEWIDTQNCTDLNACVGRVCPFHSTCIDLPPPLTTSLCSCDAGYILLDGNECVDLDACIDFPCDGNATCVDLKEAPNSPKGRACVCRPGFIGNGEPHNCTDFDTCARFPCDSRANCQELIGGPPNRNGRTCKCRTNYTGTGEPFTCYAIDHCHDHIKSGDETDMDCGGDRCQRCRVGQSCTFQTDCDYSSCQDGVCAGPNLGDPLASKSLVAVVVPISVTIFILIILALGIYCFRRYAPQTEGRPDGISLSTWLSIQSQIEGGDMEGRSHQPLPATPSGTQATVLHLDNSHSDPPNSDSVPSNLPTPTSSIPLFRDLIPRPSITVVRESDISYVNNPPSPEDVLLLTPYNPGCTTPPIPPSTSFSAPTLSSFSSSSTIPLAEVVDVHETVLLHGRGEVNNNFNSSNMSIGMGMDSVTNLQLTNTEKVGQDN